MKRWISVFIYSCSLKVDVEEEDEVELDIDLGDEIEMALGDASTQDMIDLAGIMGLHSLINQGCGR